MNKHIFLSAILMMLVTGCATTENKPDAPPSAVKATPTPANVKERTNVRESTNTKERANVREPANVKGPVSADKPTQTEELATANQLRADIVVALASLPAAQAKAVRVHKVGTVQIGPAGKSSKGAKKVLAFKSLSVDMPIAVNGTPQYNTVLSKVKAFAEQVADGRGSSEIVLGYTARDAKAQNIELGSDSTKTKANNQITVTKRVDPALKAGIRRITIKAAN